MTPHSGDISNVFDNLPPRALGSAVERFPDKKEVDGSTPSVPTNMIENHKVTLVTEPLGGNRIFAVIKNLPHTIAAALLKDALWTRLFAHRRAEQYGGEIVIEAFKAD